MTISIKIFLFAFLIIRSLCHHLYGQTMAYPCPRLGGWSYCEPSGKVVITAIYDSALAFRGQLAAVVSQGEWAYIDAQGRVRIHTYTSAEDSLPEFKNGIITTYHTHPIFGFIAQYFNKSGNMVVLVNTEMQLSNPNDTLPYIIFEPAVAIALGRGQLGKKYGQDGLDCSGFMRFVTQPFGLWLPYSAREQLSYGIGVGQAEAKAGDLILFGNGNVATHVGMIVSAKKEPIVFIHASTTKGIVQEKLDALVYWKSKVIGFRRLIY